MAGRASGIKMGDDGSGSLISPDVVAPIQIVGVCLCYLPLHHSLEEHFFWHWLTRIVPEKGRKMVVCVSALANVV